ncbi:hypothetical protein [Desulfovibrio aminophilus]|uniref:hypothetical protein n=1 Tax=Desulfovibrio aminophilus TaxID=81425 RepID=UPI000421678B|nr:hypothetical protein [Desulfovibrio aminophilus]
MPTDAVEITDTEYAALLEAQGLGKVIVPDASGRPVAVDPPAPTAEELAVIRAAAIRSELTAIDAASARPLRAILAAQTAGQTPDQDDVDRLADLEAQALDLRAELAGLGA